MLVRRKFRYGVKDANERRPSKDALKATSTIYVKKFLNEKNGTVNDR